MINFLVSLVTGQPESPLISNNISSTKTPNYSIPILTAYKISFNHKRENIVLSQCHCPCSSSARTSLGMMILLRNIQVLILEEGQSGQSYLSMVGDGDLRFCRRGILYILLLPLISNGLTKIGLIHFLTAVNVVA